MTRNFSEDEVHEHMYDTGLEKLVLDCPVIDNSSWPNINHDEEFHLWELLKKKALSKIARSHNLVRYGDFIASKLKLPTDNTKPMELDLRRLKKGAAR